MLDPKNIDKLVDFHKKSNFDIIVPSSPLFDASSKDVVKLVVNNKNKVYIFQDRQYRIFIILNQNITWNICQ